MYSIVVGLTNLFHPMSKTQLLPPKANDELAAMRFAVVQKLLPPVRLMAGRSGSFCPSQSWGGSRFSGLQHRSAMPHANATSIAPAAPKVCPVYCIVSDTGVCTKIAVGELFYHLTKHPALHPALQGLFYSHIQSGCRTVKQFFKGFVF